MSPTLKTPIGNYTLNITLTDSYQSVTYSINIDVLKNHPPYFINTAKLNGTVIDCIIGEERTFYLQNYVEPENETVSIVAS